MISGHDSEEEITEGLSAGADLYILKPIRADEVLSKISLLLNKRGHSVGAEMAENVIFASYYRIKSLLAKGGYSSVYLSEDIRDQTKVALKILDAQHTEPRYISQFIRETYELSLLHHPNIVSLLHFGNFGEKYFLVTDGGNPAVPAQTEPQCIRALQSDGAQDARQVPVEALLTEGVKRADPNMREGRSAEGRSEHVRHDPRTGRTES